MRTFENMYDSVMRSAFAVQHAVEIILNRATDAFMLFVCKPETPLACVDKKYGQLYVQKNVIDNFRCDDWSTVLSKRRRSDFVDARLEETQRRIESWIKVIVDSVRNSDISENTSVDKLLEMHSRVSLVSRSSASIPYSYMRGQMVCSAWLRCGWGLLNEDLIHTIGLVAHEHGFDRLTEIGAGNGMVAKIISSKTNLRIRATDNKDEDGYGADDIKYYDVETSSAKTEFEKSKGKREMFLFVYPRYDAVEPFACRTGSGGKASPRDSNHVLLIIGDPKDTDPWCDLDMAETTSVRTPECYERFVVLTSNSCTH